MSQLTREDVSEARQASYIGFLHRHPFASDAYRLGFATGVREDYQLQTEEYPNVELPVTILDNNFEDPDVERYLDAFQRHDPSVAMIGDAYTPGEARQYNQIAEELLDEHPYKEVIIVPKSRKAFEEISHDVVLGYPMGYSDLHPDDYSDLSDWRGRKIHLLGASPPKQMEAIDQLTQPLLTGEQPADIIGVDWNGPQKIAYKGEYWSQDGWKDADHLSIRETVRKSLEEIRRFWKENGVWPDTTPIEIHGPPSDEPDELIFMDQGGDPIPDLGDLENSYVEQYEEYGKLAFSSEHSKKRWQYYEGLDPVSNS